MIRLDKFLANRNIGSRTEVKIMIRKQRVMVNGQIVRTSDMKIDEINDKVTVDGSVITYEKYVYYMLNKPEGVVSATRDNFDKTVMDLLEEDFPSDVAPVGRLDKDTVGLLLLTNDGELTHRLLSPRKHIYKTYLVKAEKPLTDEAARQLENGVDIGEEELTKPAMVSKIDEKKFYLSICEGKFHQIKRMLEAVQNKVEFLERVSMGPLKLDETLKRGEYRRLTENEIKELRESC